MPDDDGDQPLVFEAKGSILMTAIAAPALLQLVRAAADRECPTDTQPAPQHARLLYELKEAA